MENLRKIWVELKDAAREWGDEDEWKIKSFLSYATKDKIIIHGRLIENEGVMNIEEGSRWKNVVQTLRMLESDEVAHAKIIIEAGDEVYHTQTDKEGYFYFEIPAGTVPSQTRHLEWKDVHLIAPDFENGSKPVSAKAGFILPHQNTRHIIVSDIDDTVIKTGVNSLLKLKVLWNTFFRNQYTRKPFDKISEILHQLTRDENDNFVNPVFYLSNSPWNLYPLIYELFKFRDIPLGPIFLRDFGLKTGAEYQEFKNHKILHLKRLLIDFPDFPFILLGDATEKDARIYLDMYNKHPNRIKKIFIRASTKSSKNQKVNELIAANPQAPVHLIYHSEEILNI